MQTYHILTKEWNLVDNQIIKILWFDNNFELYRDFIDNWLIDDWMREEIIHKCDCIMNIDACLSLLKYDTHWLRTVNENYNNLEVIDYIIQNPNTWLSIIYKDLLAWLSKFNDLSSSDNKS